MLSVSIGLLNLFPVPLLDGGHLLFYAVEAVRGRPLSERAQEMGFRVGLALVLMLMIFATYNDILHLGGDPDRAFCQAVADRQRIGGKWNLRCETGVCRPGEIGYKRARNGNSVGRGARVGVGYD